MVYIEKGKSSKERMHYQEKMMIDKFFIIKLGWPGSFLEFNKIIGPLTNPKEYGLDDSICFDLVMPSIPGFVFSSAPKYPYGPRKIAN